MANAMIVYHYHAATGEFLGGGEADESPLEPGVFLIPAHATTTAPPKPKNGKVAVFRDDRWTLVEDNRGGPAFDTASGLAVPVSALGPLPDTLTATPRPSSDHVWSGRSWTLDADRRAGRRRAERDGMLAGSDWTQLPDSPLDDAARAAWRDYRQALRDLDMAATEWPEPPTA